MKSLKSWIGMIVFLILSIAFTVFICKYDVQPIGPKGTSVGVASLNQYFMELCPFNETWYKITQVLGIVAIATAGLFALLGLLQLIQRESILQVDVSILGLAALYALVIILYVFFEKFVINYRPVIMPDSVVPEASFPSTHTMLICAVMGSAIIAIADQMRKSGLRLLIQLVCILLLILTVVGRMLSGVHWFTDIIGGILISTTLVLFYYGIVKSFE